MVERFEQAANASPSNFAPDLLPAEWTPPPKAAQSGPAPEAQAPSPDALAQGPRIVPVDMPDVGTGGMLGNVPYMAQLVQQFAQGHAWVPWRR